MRGAHVAGDMKAPGIQGEFLLSIDALVFQGTIPPWEKENHLKRPRKGDMLVLRRVIERTICFCLFVYLFLRFDDFDISFGMVGFIILDLLKVVGTSKKDSLKCGLMLIYHGRK